MRSDQTTPDHISHNIYCTIIWYIPVIIYIMLWQIKNSILYIIYAHEHTIFREGAESIRTLSPRRICPLAKAGASEGNVIRCAVQVLVGIWLEQRQQSEEGVVGGLGGGGVQVDVVGREVVKDRGHHQVEVVALPVGGIPSGTILCRVHLIFDIYSNVSITSVSYQH